MSGTFYGYGLPEILAGLQREKNLRATIAVERSMRRTGAGLCSSERFERKKRAHIYADAAEARLREPGFILCELFDKLLAKVGL